MSDDARASIQQALDALRRERDALDAKITAVENALFAIDKIGSSAPSKAKPAARRPAPVPKRQAAVRARIRFADVASVLPILREFTEKQGAASASELLAETGLDSYVLKNVLLRLRKAGQAATNGRSTRASRWYAVNAPGASGTPGTPEAPAADRFEEEMAKRGLVPGGGATAEPSHGTLLGKALAVVRKAGPDGLVRKRIEKALQIDPMCQRNLVSTLVKKGFVCVEGPKGAARVVALSARMETPAIAGTPATAEPAISARPVEPERPTPEPPPEVKPEPERTTGPDEQPLVKIVRRPPPVPKNPPPIVAPAVNQAPVKADPPAASARRTIKIEAIGDRDDRFLCKPLSATISAGTCLDRQEVGQAVIDPKDTSSLANKARVMKGQFVKSCGDCKYGRDVAARVKAGAS